jgi:hypothetical protein
LNGIRGGTFVTASSAEKAAINEIEGRFVTSPVSQTSVFRRVNDSLLPAERHFLPFRG